MLASYFQCNSKPVINYIIPSFAIYKLLCFHPLAYNSNELDKGIKVFSSITEYYTIWKKSFVSLSPKLMKINLGNSHLFDKQMRLSYLIPSSICGLQSGKSQSLLPKSVVALGQCSYPCLPGEVLVDGLTCPYLLVCLRVGHRDIGVYQPWGRWGLALRSFIMKDPGLLEYF